MGLIRKDLFLERFADLFLRICLYRIDVVCGSVVALLSSHFVIQMIALLLFLSATKQPGCQQVGFEKFVSLLAKISVHTSLWFIQMLFPAASTILLHMQRAL